MLIHCFYQDNLYNMMKYEDLVLSHRLCNLHKSDSLVGKHYLQKLLARNENIIGSNHP